MQPGPEAENLATNLRVLAALHEVLDLLVDLPVVVFKGPILTQRVFGHLGARASADNDLWVPRESSRVALDRLLSAGYAPAAQVDPHLGLEQRGQIALWPRGDQDAVSVDLHQRPFARPYFDVDDKVLLAHLELDTSTGRPVRTFDLPLAFCHVVAHYVQHHLADGQLALVERLWASNVPPERANRPGDDGMRALAEQRLLELADQTCGRAAARLALGRSASISGLEQRLGWESPRADQVAHLLACFRGAPPGIVRKFLALYLTAPHQLLSGIRGATFAPSELLHERYGRGPRAWLLLRHLVRVLFER